MLPLKNIWIAGQFMVQRFLSENTEGEDDPKASKLLANSDVFWGVAGNKRVRWATEGCRDPWELAIAGVRKVAILKGDDCQGGGLLLYCAPSSGWRIATAQIFAVRWRKTLRMSEKRRGYSGNADYVSGRPLVWVAADWVTDLS